MNDGILTRLRFATSDAHAQLEARVKIEEQISQASLYTGLLKKFFGWYEPLEARLECVAGWAERGIDLIHRRKTPWLEADLRALGCSAAEIARLPRCTDLPVVYSLSRGFGCAYVMEGATLGGRQISRLLLRSQIPEAARIFFSSYGAEVGEQWKEFCFALEALVLGGGNSREIIEAAQECFHSLETWMAGF